MPHPEQSSPDRRLVIYGFSLVIGGILSVGLRRYGHLSVFSVIGSFVIGAGVGWVAERIMLRSASALVGHVFAAGNIPPPPSYPIAETAAVRGRFAEAAEHYRSHLRAHPEDFEARLRLADLDIAHLGDTAEAEQLYKEIREAREDRRRELAAFNGLIDLYANTGRIDRLRVELARFADRYAGTRHAFEARRRLEDLRGEPR